MSTLPIEHAKATIECPSCKERFAIQLACDHVGTDGKKDCTKDARFCASHAQREKGIDNP